LTYDKACGQKDWLVLIIHYLSCYLALYTSLCMM
jgi:hypothetical protein